MSEHTKEPWRVAEESFDNDGIHESVIRGLDDRAAIAVTLEFGPNNPGMREANARRIVACVNACAGIPTEVLEQMPVGPSALEQQRDKLLAALEGLTDDICSLIDESSGVANLHLNGDIAFWSELEAGGQFERLTHLPDALRIIAEVKGQP